MSEDYYFKSLISNVMKIKIKKQKKIKTNKKRRRRRTHKITKRDPEMTKRWVGIGSNQNLIMTQVVPIKLKRTRV
jgi:hypothetical protein